MPTTPYALLRIRVNGGAPQTGGVAVTFEDTIELDAESTVGWATPAARWEITDYPDGWATPAGWSLDGVTGAIYYTASNITGTTPPSFDLPTAASNMWGKWKFRLLVNGGGGNLTDWSSAVEIVSTAGVHDIAAAESSEFGGVRNWVGPLKEDLRTLSAAIEGGVGGGVSLGAGTPHTVSAAAGGASGSLTAAPFGHWHQVLVGTPVAIGEANSDGAADTLARSNHVHDHGNLTGGSRHALAVANVSHGFLSATDKAKIDGIAAGAQVVNFTNVNAALATANASIDINGQKITNGAAPTAASDFVIKSYVDGLLFGLDLKGSVRGASLANQTLSGALTEDGITYATGNRYLAKNQTTASENGIYVVDTGGAWTRATDADSSAEVTPGLYVYVEEGTSNQKTGWALTTAAPIVVGTTALTFTQIYGPGSITAGAGLTQSGTTLDVGAGAGIQVNANSVEVLYAAGGTLTTVNAGDTASAGSSDTAARGDHQHPVSTAAPSVLVVTDAGVASEGSATSLLRSDAQLLAKTAAPVAIGTANSIGVSDSLARANHVHDHGSQSTSTHHAVAVSGGANGFLSGTDKAKLDGIAASAAALGGATPLPPAVTAVVGVSATGSHDDHVHPWGTAAAGLALNRPQHASGAGLKDAIRGQAAASGAHAGGSLELGGGAAGDATVKAGDTLVVLGAAPTGSTSALFNVCANDGGSSYFKVNYSDTLSRVVIDGTHRFYVAQGIRNAATLSHIPYTDTDVAGTVTFVEGKSIRRRVLLGTNTTFAAPTGFEDGTELIVFLTQGIGAPYTATWNAAFKFPTGMSGTLVGTVAGNVDVFRFLFEVDTWVCVTHVSY